MSFDLVLEKIARGSPVQDKDYLVSDEDGWTIAHVLAAEKVFPVDFEHWEAKDHKGFSVAHQAAFHKKLPTGFTKWLIVDLKGDSVAHIAARNGTFPTVYQNNHNVFYKHVNHAGVSVKDEVKAFGTSRLEAMKTLLKGKMS